MTNLTDKFTAIDVHLAQRHQEVIVAINALLTALGAPPPEPGATLADVVGGLNQLHAQLATLQTALITQHMELKDTFTRNTQLLLIGLSALDPCKPCDVPSYQLPPIDATPVAVDQEHCKRVQALLYAILRFCVKLDVLSSLGTGFNPQIISAAFTEVITEINAAQSLTISLPSFGEILTLVASCVAFVASNIFAGNTLQGSFMSIQDSLIAPLYAATTAEAGMAAYRAGIDASDLPSAIKAVLKAAGYISLFNLYYGNTPINLAGFDGTICAPDPLANCFATTIDDIRTFSVTNTLKENQHATYTAVIWPATFTGRLSTYAGHKTAGGGEDINIVADNGDLFVLEKDIFGYFAKGGHVYDNNETALAAGSNWTQIGIHTTAIFVLLDGPTDTFTLCPPSSQPPGPF